MLKPGYRFFSGLLFLSLFWALFSYSAIPFYKFLGLDFHNLHAFHNCEFASNPYSIPGNQCGDVSGRPMNYPPLLYWSYFWTRGLSFGSAYVVFCVLLILSMIASFWLIMQSSISMKRESKTYTLKAYVFWGMLLGSMPFVFTFERGNSDGFVVLIFCACMFAFSSKRYFLWGVLSALAVLYKLYPAIPCAILGMAFLLQMMRQKPGSMAPIFKAAAGAALIIAILVLVLLEQHQIYFTRVLPNFSKINTGINLFSHSIFGLDVLHPYASLVARGSLLLCWFLFALRRMRQDPELSFSGTLAISTFFSGTSYDYNLVTVFPLLLTLFVRSRKSVELLYLILGVLAFLGSREIWHSASPQELRVIAEVFWLSCLPVIALIRPEFYAARAGLNQAGAGSALDGA